MKDFCFGCDEEIREVSLENKEKILLGGVYSKEDFLKEVSRSKGKILVLKRDFFLNLSGENLILSVSHLKVEEEAKILTFEKGSKTERGMSGRNGGIIDLKIDEGEGYLFKRFTN